MNISINMREKVFKIWQKKSAKSIQRELDSWRKHIKKYPGCNKEPPNSLSEGDRIAILKEILNCCKSKEDYMCEFCDCWKSSRAMCG